MRCASLPRAYSDVICCCMTCAHLLCARCAWIVAAAAISCLRLYSNPGLMMVPFVCLYIYVPLSGALDRLPVSTNKVIDPLSPEGQPGACAAQYLMEIPTHHIFKMSIAQSQPSGLSWPNLDKHKKPRCDHIIIVNVGPSFSVPNLVDRNRCSNPIRTLCASQPLWSLCPQHKKIRCGICPSRLRVGRASALRIIIIIFLDNKLQLRIRNRGTESVEGIKQLHLQQSPAGNALFIFKCFRKKYSTSIWSTYIFILCSQISTLLTKLILARSSEMANICFSNHFLSLLRWVAQI